PETFPFTNYFRNVNETISGNWSRLYFDFKSTKKIDKMYRLYKRLKSECHAGVMFKRTENHIGITGNISNMLPETKYDRFSESRNASLFSENSTSLLSDFRALLFLLHPKETFAVVHSWRAAYDH
ncbi:MAG: hypothetical protein ACOCWW_01060, partial [Bacteroidota bacterium]